MTAFSTTRRGGFSLGSYGELNINPYCGDRPEAVAANRVALCRELGIADDHLILPHQTHQTAVACINRHFLLSAPAERQAAMEGIDALMTDLEGVCIGVSTADCIPILLYDSPHHAVCAVHAGWRGTVGRIAQRAISAMAAAYGTRPDDLVAQIGPGISLDSFEVGQEVCDAFQQAGFHISLIGRRYPSSKASEMLRWHINLPLCNAMQLQEAGVKQEAIAMSSVCTFRLYDTYFSARRLGIQSGRIFTGIMITPSEPLACSAHP